MLLWHIDESSQRMPLIVITIFTFLAGLAVTARISARYLQRIPLAANDYLMLIALFVTCGLCACEFLAILLGGVGLHQEDVLETNPQSLTILGILVFMLQILWPIVQGLIKASTCLLYIAVFQQSRFQSVATAVLTLCAMFSISMIIVTLVICMPTSAQWDPTVPGATCGNRVSLWFWGGVFNVVTDAVVIYLPMPMVWSLYVPQGKKLMLSALFGVGILVTVVSIIRLHYVLAVDFSVDTTYTVAPAAMWSYIESTLGIIASCIPVIGPAVRCVVPEHIARRWTYTRSSPGPGSDNRRSVRNNVTDEESGNAGRRTTGEWFGRPCATRAPTPHPIAMLEKGSRAEVTVAELDIDIEKMPRVSSQEVREENVVDSMERGEGIMVKVEWEVTSGERASWPLTRLNSMASSEVAVEAGSQKMAGA